MNRRTFLQIIPPAALFSSLFLKGKSAGSGLFDDQDELICIKKFEAARSLNLAEKPINEIIVEIGKTFIGVSYTAGTLDTPGEEKLVINLRTLDCVTLFENSLALGRCIRKNQTTFDSFKNELKFIRYRGGIINKYPSRLHYTSDYFFDNEKKEVLKNITKEIGGIRYKKKIDFMSTHSDSYLPLRENQDFIKSITEQEDEINKRSMYYIPKLRLGKFASLIKDGDILGITTSIKGLDCSHTGIAVWKNMKLHMLHAPAPGMKVQITDLPLNEYLTKLGKDTGIIVARPLEPKL